MRALPETWQLIDRLLKCPIGDVRVRPARHSQVRVTEKLLNGVSGALQRPGSAHGHLPRLKIGVPTATPT
jgi:hypothetical protein